MKGYEAAKERFDAEREAAEEEGFQDFMQAPLTRLALSLIPPGEHQDTLALLLRAAFNAGAGTGGAGVMRMVVSSIREKPGGENG